MDDHKRIWLWKGEHWRRRLRTQTLSRLLQLCLARPEQAQLSCMYVHAGNAIRMERRQWSGAEAMAA